MRRDFTNLLLRCSTCLYERLYVLLRNNGGIPSICPCGGIYAAVRSAPEGCGLPLYEEVWPKEWDGKKIVWLCGTCGARQIGTRWTCDECGEGAGGITEGDVEMVPEGLLVVSMEERLGQVRSHQ